MMADQQMAIEGLLRWDLLGDPQVLARCTEELRTHGIMVIKDFATATGLARLREEVRELPANEASLAARTAYQDQGDLERYPPDHPRNYRFQSSVGFVGRKVLERAPERLGVSLYEDPEDRLLRFLSRVSARPQDEPLHRSTDENGSVYSYLATPAHDPPWHFDEAHCTAIIYLQNGDADGSASGGHFEFAPFSRPTKSKDDVDGHDIVREVLMEGDMSRVVRVPAEPGSLVFFFGSHALHRAAAPSGSGAADDGAGSSSSDTGDADRIGLVFTFGETAEVANSDETKNNNGWDPTDDDVVGAPRSAAAGGSGGGSSSSKL
jgi:hypothetical protein